MGPRGRKGVTLMELLIAVLVLAVVSGPIMLLIQNAASHTAVARDYTIAGFAAQQAMEELIDEERSIILEKDGTSVLNGSFTISYSIDYSGVPADLLGVRIEVSLNGKVLSTLENVLYAP